MAEKKGCVRDCVNLRIPAIDGRLEELERDLFKLQIDRSVRESVDKIAMTKQGAPPPPRAWRLTAAWGRRTRRSHVLAASITA